MSDAPSLDTPRAQAGGATRVFYALAPPASLIAALSELAQAIAHRAHGRASRRETLHLTLAFLGNVPNERLGELLAIDAACGADAFRLDLDSVGTFAGSGIAWLAPARVPAALSVLHAALADALSARGFALEARAFRPHLTLARHCRLVVREALPSAIRWDADRVTLIASELRPEGSHHRELAAWSLNGEK